MIAAELLPACACLDRLRPDWDRLYRCGRREPSVSFEWSRAIIRNHLAGRQDWFIVLLRRGAAIEGVIPMMVVRERLMGRSITTLQPIQEQNNTHSDLLLSEHSPELLGAWLDALARANERWDLLRMSRLLEHSELHEGLARELARRRVPFRMRLQQPSYHLQLPSGYAQYLSQRSGKFRNYLRRAQKKLDGDGKVDFLRVGRSHDFAACYEDLLSIERDSWKHAHGTAITAVAHQSGFYRDLAEAALHADMLHLTFLRVDEVPVAYNLGLVADGCYFYLKTSHRERYRAQGAASIGRARLVELLIAEGLAELDFPGEPYEWETQWTEGLRWHRSLLLYNGTLAGRALWLLNSARELWRGAREDRRVIHHDPRAVDS